MLCENVRGLLRPSFTPYFQYILRQLGAPDERRREGELWYEHDRRLQKTESKDGGDQAERYRFYPMPVNAADYGVPQIRQRVIIVAFRLDLDVNWSTPAATHSESLLIEAQRSGKYWDEHGISHQAPGRGGKPAPIDADDLERWQTLRDARTSYSHVLPRREDLSHPRPRRDGWRTLMISLALIMVEKP